MDEISRMDWTMTYVDTSPSELIHSLTDRIIIFSHINFDHIALNDIEVRQYKETRKERKIQMQDSIINFFEKKQIVGYGTIRYNSQKIALWNARTFLLDSEFITIKELQFAERIMIDGENITVGHLLSLTWYALLLSSTFVSTAIWTKVELKKQGLILMDLLPTDSVESRRSLKIVRFLINNSFLNDRLQYACKKHEIKMLAYGYGSKGGSTKELKKSHPFAISDWITQSFYCKLRCAKFTQDEYYEKNIQYTKLADYLIAKKFFLIETPFRIVPD